MMRERSVAPSAVPASLAAMVVGYRWRRDMVGQSGGAVFRLHAPDRATLYLKHGNGAVGAAIVDEMVRLRWLADRIDTPRVCGFVVDDDGAWLLTTGLAGRTAWQWLTDGRRMPDVVDHLAGYLRRLHAVPVDDCPFDSGAAVRLAQARRLVDAGTVDVDDFGDDHRGWTAQAVWQKACSLRPRSADRVLTHGDFSLDNILIDDGGVTGCIDLGRVGVGDRYADLAILWDSLGEFGVALQRRLFSAYGIARPNRRKLAFHLCLDELF